MPDGDDDRSCGNDKGPCITDEALPLPLTLVLVLVLALALVLVIALLLVLLLALLVLEMLAPRSPSSLRSVVSSSFLSFSDTTTVR